MGSAGDELQVLFITVDPENDTPDEIRRYLDLFDRSTFGATGTDAQLKAVRVRYQAMAKKVPQEGGGYSVDHSATVFVMGRQGEFLTTIDGHEPEETALAKLRMAV
jgi:protein SCO1